MLSIVLESTHDCCKARGIPVVGHLLHDPEVTKAMVRGQAVTEGENTPFGAQVRRVWAELQSLLETSPQALLMEKSS